MSRRRPSDGVSDGLSLDLFGAEPAAPARREAPRARAEPSSPAPAAASPEFTIPPLTAAPEPHEFPGSSAASAVGISTLTTTAREVLEGAFMPLWVRGEVSDFKKHRNGHWYFSLRDESAQVRCVVWARDQRNIPAAPDDGMQVSALGQVTVYVARGDLQLTVKAMEAAGDGLWRKALELARQSLERDGLLASERKRRLPRFPRRVAVVTSPSGAALHDIISVARRRWPAVELVIVPAKVQGEGAPEEICAALEMVGRWKDADVVIVGRGGGAREDLWAFNDERVARAVASCPIPTISAVGHEVDFTLCDLVADLRAATPSAAAEAAVPVHADTVAKVRRLSVELRGAIGRRIAFGEEERRRVARSLARGGERLLERRNARARQLAGRLNALSPLATLARGYAVARSEDGSRTLSSVEDFSEGGSFSLLVRDGSVDATVSRVKPGGTDNGPAQVDGPETVDGLVR